MNIHNRDIYFLSSTLLHLRCLHLYLFSALMYDMWQNEIKWLRSQVEKKAYVYWITICVSSFFFLIDTTHAFSSSFHHFAATASHSHRAAIDPLCSSNGGTLLFLIHTPPFFRFRHVINLRFWTTTRSRGSNLDVAFFLMTTFIFMVVEIIVGTDVATTERGRGIGNDWDEERGIRMFILTF